MEDEITKLRRDLERYRFLLRENVDRRTGAVIRELLAQAEDRLNALAKPSTAVDARSESVILAQWPLWPTART